jgi:hypothetical protein
MKRHSFLHAYMAGVLLPSWFLLILLGLFLAGEATHHVPEGLERAIIFPMAVVPNVWGCWNAFYLALRLRRRLRIGVYGALLPLILVPAGIALADALGARFFTLSQALIALPVVMAVYYLAWEYGVGFFNAVAGLE